MSLLKGPLARYRGNIAESALPRTMNPVVLRAYGIYDPRSRLLRKASPATTNVPLHLRNIVLPIDLARTRPPMRRFIINARFIFSRPSPLVPARRDVRSWYILRDRRPTYIRVYLPIISRRILSTDEMYPPVHTYGSLISFSFSNADSNSSSFSLRPSPLRHAPSVSEREDNGRVGRAQCVRGVAAWNT